MSDRCVATDVVERIAEAFHAAYERHAPEFVAHTSPSSEAREASPPVEDDDSGTDRRGAFHLVLTQVERSALVTLLKARSESEGATYGRIMTAILSKLATAAPRDPGVPAETCICGHAANRHRVGDEDGGPGPCRDCDCIEYADPPPGALDPATTQLAGEKVGPGAENPTSVGLDPEGIEAAKRTAFEAWITRESAAINAGVRPLVSPREMWNAGYDAAVTAYLGAARPDADQTQELRERMHLIERFAAVLADPACDGDCEGSGIDEEGAEWSLCECALTHLQRLEAVAAALPEGSSE